MGYRSRLLRTPSKAVERSTLAQLEDDEWRMVMLAPARGVLILFIVITLRDGVEDDDTDKEIPPYWNVDNAIIRIISARKADTEDQIRYLENGI